MTKIQVLTFTFAMVAVFGFSCTSPAQAQDIRFVVNAATDEPVALATEEIVVDPAGDARLASMSKAWWKQLRHEHRDALRSPDPALREQALRNIIFLRTHYQDQARFKSAANTVYEIYRLDRDEQIRVMALTALHAIGEEDTMRQLARDVKTERSDRVRRLTEAALADYFGARK